MGHSGFLASHHRRCTWVLVCWHAEILTSEAAHHGGYGVAHLAPAAAGAFDDGHEEFDLGAAAGAAFDFDFGGVAVEDLHAFADVLHADAGAAAGCAYDSLPYRPLRGHADAVVFYFDEQSAFAGDAAAKGNGAAVDAGFEAVLDGVFDERLEQHAGDDDAESVVGDFFDDAELFAEADDLDVEVVVGEGELFGEGGRRLRGL